MSGVLKCLLVSVLLVSGGLAYEIDPASKARLERHLPRTLGKLLERNAKEKVLEDLDAFFSLKPTKVKICSQEYPEGRYVAAEYLQKDDLFILDDGDCTG